LKKLVFCAALMALILVIGAGTAFAAPGEYPINGTPAYDTGWYPTGALTDISGPLSNPDDPSISTDPDTMDNGLLNANRSGYGTDGSDITGPAVVSGVEKTVPLTQQRTHGDYKNDTNSCASCHQTHTAAGDALLIKDGMYNTCAACHDGTLGFYDVFGNTGWSSAGTFGGTESASMHLATGAVQISFAPGGDTSGESGNNAWSDDFTCASCHAPHGSYSDRLLHYNPVGVSQPVTVTATVYYADGVNTVFQAAYAPWVFSDAATDNPTKFYVDTFLIAPENVKIDYAKGLFKFAAAVNATSSSVVTAQVVPAIVVKLDMEAVIPSQTTASGLPIMKVTSYSESINDYCGACHTNYNVGGGMGSEPSATYGPEAFRHPMGVSMGGLETAKMPASDDGKLVCVSCHYAHGTDKTFMYNADDNLTSTTDNSSSTALKRYVNMAVCWKCHKDLVNDTLRNDAAFFTNYDVLQ
jgi:predicted CXXCH cytochrome family protein